jgi:phosphoribulokinase
MSDAYNIVQYVDLLVGVVPIVNLEWIQKIHRDTHNRGYSQDAVVETIINRMEDYVHDIVPQFAHTHVNFQRIPLVDTSNPFVVRDVPTEDESMVVIRFWDSSEVDFPYLLQMIAGSHLSRYDTLVIPGTKMSLAMDLIMRPLVLDLMAHKPFA